MDIIDGIILIITVVGLVWGYLKGLIGQVTTICGIVLGITACHLWGNWCTSVLIEIIPESANWPEPKYTTSAIANIVLFLFMYLSTKVIGAMCQSIVTKLHIGIIDRLAGALFCVFKYMLIVSIILNVWYMLSPDNTLFTKRHALNNIPFQITMNIAPALLGVNSLPQILDDLNKSFEEKKN